MGPVRVVYATGSSDQVSYHGSTRGATIVEFYSKPIVPQSRKRAEERAKYTEEVQNVTIVMPGAKVPAQVTTYMCSAFTLPDVPDAHIIKIDPVIDITSQATNPDFVHHMLVHVCEATPFWQKYQTPAECDSPLGNSESGCTSLLFAWAVGMGPLTLPLEAGFRMGKTASYGVVHLILEFHYNNVELRDDIVDRSGIRVHYTTNLRQFDASVMTLGDTVVTLPDIPPRNPYVEYETNCPTECTSKWSHSITVFADFQHMHQVSAINPYFFNTKEGETIQSTFVKESSVLREYYSINMSEKVVHLTRKNNSVMITSFINV
eukprot:TRINITY_DN896_c0_g2_i2.p1 TRINITY_DN896_c0_g2~~TRINITY_DN896_c0_g2_i2.p1  ORF type:complete len:319 (+),score=39.47 TRINITY_DN896_c0_g2_i2:1267-2223(+)